jgi:hypothetical protein
MNYRCAGAAVSLRACTLWQILAFFVKLRVS